MRAIRMWAPESAGGERTVSGGGFGGGDGMELRDHAGQRGFLDDACDDDAERCGRQGGEDVELHFGGERTDGVAGRAGIAVHAVGERGRGGAAERYVFVEPDTGERESVCLDEGIGDESGESESAVGADDADGRSVRERDADAGLSVQQQFHGAQYVYEHLSEFRGVYVGLYCE